MEFEIGQTVRYMSFVDGWVDATVVSVTPELRVTYLDNWGNARTVPTSAAFVSTDTDRIIF